MAMQSKRANEIDAYIKDKPSCARGKQKVEIKGKIEPLESYMLPLSYLQYNRENRRFNLEIQEYETNVGRKLDSTNKEDVEKIKELLLQDENEATKLYDDLKLLGEQREVAAVTHDGVVVNGNRRMATIELLHKENPKKWDELWVVRLPKDISDKDLWKIEAGLQLSKEKVADYGPVNNLLMIREGKRAGLSTSEIAASMYGWSEKQVATDLERLDLIDTFLNFMGGSNKNNYGLIKRFQLSEHFIDIQKGLVEKLKSVASRRELTKKLETVFLFLKAHIESPNIMKITHWDVRAMCKILLDEQTSYTLTESFDKYKNNLKKIPVEMLVENFDRATDIKKDREYANKPVKLIDRAIAALNSIDRKGRYYKKENVKKKVKELDTLIKTIKRELGIIN